LEAQAATFYTRPTGQRDAILPTTIGGVYLPNTLGGRNSVPPRAGRLGFRTLPDQVYLYRMTDLFLTIVLMSTAHASRFGLQYVHFISWLCNPARAMASCGSAAQRGLWPPRPRGFVITRSDAPQSVGLPWTRDQLVAETFTRQHATHTHTQQTSISPVGLEPTITVGERT
jgi:hypothetical protein